MGSWLTTITVVPWRSRTPRSRSRIPRVLTESSAPVGSSASSSRGRFASARAIATPWRSPPESLAGR